MFVHSHSVFFSVTQSVMFVSAMHYKELKGKSVKTDIGVGKKWTLCFVTLQTFGMRRKAAEHTKRRGKTQKAKYGLFKNTIPWKLIADEY